MGGFFGTLIGKIIACVVIGGLGCPGNGDGNNGKSIQQAPVTSLTYTYTVSAGSLMYVCSLDPSVTPQALPSGATRLKVQVYPHQEQCAAHMEEDAKGIASDKQNCGGTWSYYSRPGDDPGWTALASRALTAEVDSLCKGFQPNPRGTNDNRLAQTPAGNGHGVTPVWNSDGSVDADGSHYISGRAFCQAQMPLRVGGVTAAWDQSRERDGKLIQACQLLTTAELTSLAFLPGTINHTSINGRNVTAVGPGNAAVDGVTVFWDTGLKKYAGYWARNLLTASNVVPYDRWTPIGSPLESN